MATLAEAEGLLEELRQTSFEAGKAELAETEAFARDRGHEGPFLNWDVTFWSERMKEAKYEINDEVLRPYFALPNVLDGLFAVRPVLFSTLHARAVRCLQASLAAPGSCRACSFQVMYCEQATAPYNLSSCFLDEHQYRLHSRDGGLHGVAPQWPARHRAAPLCSPIVSLHGGLHGRRYNEGI